MLFLRVVGKESNEGWKKPGLPDTSRKAPLPGLGQDSSFWARYWSSYFLLFCPRPELCILFFSFFFHNQNDNKTSLNPDWSIKVYNSPLLQPFPWNQLASDKRASRMKSMQFRIIDLFHICYISKPIHLLKKPSKQNQMWRQEQLSEQYEAISVCQLTEMREFLTEKTPIW